MTDRHLDLGSRGNLEVGALLPALAAWAEDHGRTLLVSFHPVLRETPWLAAAGSCSARQTLSAALAELWAKAPREGSV